VEKQQYIKDLAPALVLSHTPITNVMPAFNLFSRKSSSSSYSSSPTDTETRKLGWDNLPISRRTMTIAICKGATFGPDKIPLMYATLNAPAEAVATFTFETDRDCTADAFEIMFKGIARIKANSECLHFTIPKTKKRTRIILHLINSTLGVLNPAILRHIDAPGVTLVHGEMRQQQNN